jgi:hypothetical protein
MKYKYVITAKGIDDVNSGNFTFGTGTPTTQTESATELIINRLAVIDYLNRGIIDEDTIVVTLKERTFLYENIFKSVEVYDSNKIYDDCLDLVTDDKLNELSKTLPYKPFYQNYERDKSNILNINYNDTIINSILPEFIVCIPRLKNSDIRRNLNQLYWIDFIDKVKEKYDLIIVFGKGNENLIGENVKYVDTLKDYCSYLHHPNCKNVVSTISGPCHYAQHFGNVNNDTILTMIDNRNLIKKYGDDPSYFHPCINFTNVKINFINELIEPEKLMEKITNYDR